MKLIQLCLTNDSNFSAIFANFLGEKIAVFNSKPNVMMQLLQKLEVV
jgi:hypothetical protein